MHVCVYACVYVCRHAFICMFGYNVHCMKIINNYGSKSGSNV